MTHLEGESYGVGSAGPQRQCIAMPSSGAKSSYCEEEHDPGNDQTMGRIKRDKKNYDFVVYYPPFINPQ